MKYGPPTSGQPDSSWQMSAVEASEAGPAFHFGSQIEASRDYPPPTYRWVATFAHISPTGVLTTGAYFRDPSDAKIKCFLVPLWNVPLY
jgi:hypothetical protein